MTLLDRLVLGETSGGGEFKIDEVLGEGGEKRFVRILVSLVSMLDATVHWVTRGVWDEGLSSLLLLVEDVGLRVLD